MLLVNARADVSPIHGLGLIAKEFIAAGTSVWQFREGFDVELSPQQLAELSPASREQVLHYGWYVEQIDRYLMSSDDERFMNHSSDPNTNWDGDSVVALRDIAKGEEMTYDYDELSGNGLHGYPGQ